ncbi:MAG: class I SAM-dependent methyltransferase [Proteobacteria bacterium]|nr:class I SAM-dependent methyltransferase [Pseudomonadota bacterium]MDA1331291.1 class I SAM-dependent methyltransferase [Pseudomonadota bacterium]
MNFYEKYILPPILNCACGLSSLKSHREDIVSRAKGAVLEIGIGSSLNLDFYKQDQITEITGIDPNESLLKIAQRSNPNKTPKINLIAGISEQLPFSDRQFDSAVVTFSFCTIPNPEIAIREIKRTLKPKGLLHFCEHGISDSPHLKKWQQRIEPIWKPLAGGCHLTRDIFALIASNGFQLFDHKTIYADHVPKVVGHLYSGSAIKQS